MYDADTFNWQEEFIMLCLNQRNQIIGYYKVSRGGTTATVCDAKVIFTIALNTPGTTSLILSHNHPSGNLTPSKADKKLTSQIIEAGKVLDIRILDHIILTDDGFYSFANEGIMY